MAQEGTDGPTVGVVGTGVGDVAAVLDGDAVTGSVSDVLAADPAWFVAGGESALLELVRAGVDGPVLPVAAGRGVASVSPAEATDAVQSVLAGDAVEATRRMASVRVDGEETAALFDVALVTAEAAQISEYEVLADDRRVARFRADGVVVATPAGSYGYANDVGGPVVEPGTDVGAVVPVAPFVTDADHWVLDLASVSVNVHRDEPVSVVVDDREWKSVTPGETVHLGLGEHLRLFRVPGSDGFAAASGLEKL
ncbi:ATP-NAD kinase [Halobacteriales archaeon QS_1_68_20]|nr:MAG: ATP-NAD kinase [Halobacteriales archaeon QS_1_68_20]